MSDSSDNDDQAGRPDISNLFPAIAQSFAVILIGYLFGRFKIIPPSDSKSIGILVAKLALPALLFKNLAILDLSVISWTFMLGILLAKSIVFIVVALLTVIVTRPVAIGKAGLFGIFATQSNDFALGLPIVQALYGSSSTTLGDFDYVSYIYLLAPVSLCIINPVAFFMLEYSKQSSRSKVALREMPYLVLKIVRGVAMNPVVFMTAFGIIVNVVVYYGIHKGDEDSSKNLPKWLTGFLDILGGAYAACALFNIGIFMVGKLKKLSGSVILVAALLIVAKTIVLPLVAYPLVYSLTPGAEENSSRSDIATFGFLYGTFPTAPTVFVFASQFNVAMEVTAAAIVLCTFMSAPIMYISARMVLVSYISEDQYSRIIKNTRRDVAAITVVCVVWVMFLFVLAKRYRSYIHVFVMHLMVAMLLECVGGELLSMYGAKEQIYWEYFWFAVFFPSVLATRMWMAWLAVGLMLLLLKGPRVAERAWLPMMLSAWGIPIVITVVMVVVCATQTSSLHKKNMVDVSFLFGQVQLVISLVVLILTFIVGTVCLITIVITARKNKRSKNRGVRNEMSESPSISSATQRRRNLVVRDNSEINSGGHTESTSSEPYILVASKSNCAQNRTSSSSGLSQDILVSSTQQKGSLSSTHSSHSDLQADERTPLLQQSSRSVHSDPSSMGFGSVQMPGISKKDISGKQVTRFIVLLMFLLFSCLVGVMLVFWKLTTNNISGIFIAASVLDTVTNFGQGFFVFAVFGFEKHWFWVAVFKRIRHFLFKIETVVLLPQKDLSVAVVNLCNTFKTQYLHNCKNDIVSDKRYYLRVYESVFTGTDLVDWLLDRGLAETREDAVQYGHSLMLGRVIAHVTEEHYFHDEPYYYRFCNHDCR